MAKRSKDKGLKLHPEYGVNATMLVCNWCQEATGEIALLGAAYKGEAPMRMVVDDKPCGRCKKAMRGNIVVVEVNDDKTRTGRWAILQREAVAHMPFNDEEKAEILRTGGVLIRPDPLGNSLFDQVRAMKEAGEIPFAPGETN